MKSIILSAFFLLISIFVKAQNLESVTLGTKEVIFSKVLNEKRKIWIYTPNMTSQMSNPNKRYPVLYLLDGDSHFFSTVGMIQQLSQANGNGVLPEMIVVAIENTDRSRDLIPLDDLTKTNPFITFLSSELIPYIDKNYKTAPYKLLVGHSLGGLTAIDVLTKYPKLFNAHIAIDPSMWYNNEKFLKNTIAQLPKQNMKGNSLFIATANTMPKGMTISQLKKDNSNETQHMRPIFKLNDYLKINTNGLRYGQKYYEKEGHNTVPMISEYDGLRFIFDYFQFDANEKDFADSTSLIASRLKAHYAKVSEKMGYKNSAPEALINYIAYDALGKKQFIKAKALFELNIEWYPENSNPYDAYADYFMTKKDTVNAITFYKKALIIDKNTATENKLNSLLTKKTSTPTTVELQKYTGEYIIEAYNVSLILEIRDSKLWAKVPGQEDVEFQPLSENIFTVNGKPGYTITFQMDGNKPKGFTSVEPNGTFKVTFKSK